MEDCFVKRALIVDDIFVNRFLIGEILTQLGIEYDEAENGKQAIDKIPSGNYDVILMDIEMPVMNGIEATLYIKSNFALSHPNLRVVGVTAHDPASFFKDYKDVSFDAFVTKPYTFEKLNEVLCHKIEKTI